MAFPDLPDLELPELSQLPDLSGFDEILGGGQQRSSSETSCPVCEWVEENVCRPHMKEGDPKECARAIFEKRREVEHRSRSERIQEIGKVFARYGIPLDVRLAPGGA